MPWTEIYVNLSWTLHRLPSLKQMAMTCFHVTPASNAANATVSPVFSSSDLTDHDTGFAPDPGASSWLAVSVVSSSQHFLVSCDQYACEAGCSAGITRQQGT